MVAHAFEFKNRTTPRSTSTRSCCISKESVPIGAVLCEGTAVKHGFVQLDRMTIEQGFMAFAAPRLVAGPLRRHVVGGIAMRAGDMKRVTNADS